MLPGWEKSEGARIEEQVALWLGLEVTYAEDAYNPDANPLDVVNAVSL
jgi:hypothetical protein